MPLDVNETVAIDNIKFQNPPWQIISQNESDLAETSGVVMDVLREISKKLNFTYTLHVTNILQVNSNMTFNEEYNSSVSFGFSNHKNF